MNFRISSNKLHAVLQVLSRVVASKSTVPSLESILFRIQDEKLFLTASDGETRLETAIDIESKEGEDLSFIVKSKFLLDPLREIPEQVVSFEVNDSDYHTIVSYHNGQFVFRAESAETYPNTEELPDNAPGYTLPIEVLDKGIGYTMFATSNDTSRAITMGIYMQAKSDGLVFVGTDGFLMSIYKVKDIQTESESSFILNKKPAGLLRNLLSKEDDGEKKLTLKVGNKCVRIETSDFTLYASLIAGTYPDYTKVLPSTPPNKLMVDREKMLASLRRVSMFSDKTFGLVSLNLQSNEVMLQSADADFATSADEKVEVSYDGIEQKVAFRSGHLIDVLSNYNCSENILFCLGDKSSSGYISPSPQKDNEELMALVMPLMN